MLLNDERRYGQKGNHQNQANHLNHQNNGNPPRTHVPPLGDARSFLCYLEAQPLFARHGFLKPPNSDLFPFFLFFPEQGQFMQFPLRRHLCFSGATMTLLPLGAISKPFSPLKKSRFSGTRHRLSRHRNVQQPKGHISRKL
jgi:hypothetical protein